MKRLGYLTTEFQRLRHGVHNATVVDPLWSATLLATTKERRGCLIEFSSPYYMRKRENAGEHDRIKAATIFNTD